MFFMILFLVLFYCAQKEGYFLDEIYSYGLANSENHPFLWNIVSDNNIVTRQTLFDYITVNQDKFNYVSVYCNQIPDVHPPLFYFLLHTVSSFFPNTFSKWIGLSLNIIIFILTLFVLYKTAAALFHSKEISGFVVVLYGLSTIAISTVIMIRMYMLLTLFTTLLVYEFVQFLNGKNNYISILIVIYLGMMTQYFFAFFTLFLCICTGIYLLKKKEYRRLLLLFISCVAAVMLLFLTFPACISQLTANKGPSGNGVISRLKDVGSYKGRIIAFSKFVYHGMFAAGIIFLLIVVCGLVYHLLNRKNRVSMPSNDSGRIILILLLAFIPSFLLISIVAPYQKERYIYHIIPLTVLFIGFALYYFNYPEKIYKWLMIIALPLSYYGTIRYQPDNLYKSDKQYIQELSSYTDDPCIYIQAYNSNPPITQDLVFLLQFDEVFLTEKLPTEKLDSFIEAHKNADHLVVFIGEYPKDQDESELLKSIQKLYGYESVENKYLNKTSFSKTYVLSKSDNNN